MLYRLLMISLSRKYFSAGRGEPLHETLYCNEHFGDNDVCCRFIVHVRVLSTYGQCLLKFQCLLI